VLTEGQQRKINRLDWERLCRRLGYHFRNPTLLRQALIHSSFNNDPNENNGPLEFLGDRVLNLIVALEMGQRSQKVFVPDFDRLRSNQNFVKLAKKLGLEDYLLAVKNKDEKRKVHPSWLADAFEAIAAAVFIDSGYDYCATAKIFTPLIFEEIQPLGVESQEEKEIPFSHHVVDLMLEKDSRTELGRLVRTVFETVPEYRKLNPPKGNGNGQVTVEITVKGLRIGNGQGKNIATASENAARRTLQHTRRLTINLPLELKMEPQPQA
jgi:ribonuclease-3